MPLYDFKCTHCQHEWEELAKNTEKELGCVECGWKAVRLENYKPVAIGLPNGFHTMRTKQVKKDGL
jgi:putative FmdB family regulatory protein